MNQSLEQRLQTELASLQEAGTYKRLRYLETPMGPVVRMEGRGEVLVMSSNDYLGLANHPRVVEAAQKALKQYGAGAASVRFICGTFTIHRQLEEKIAAFVGKESALLYSSCWNANEGLIPTLVGEGDVVLSDALNHASIIDGCRLIRGAQRAVYPHNDLNRLEELLKEHQDKRTKLIISDAVFSMEGDIAHLPELVRLAKEHNAVVVIDDSHGTGVLGKTGRGLAEHYGLQEETDIITGTFGKALSGSAGGFVAGSRALTDYLVQKSRPHLFSNSVPPAVCAAALAALTVLEENPQLVQTLRDNVAYFMREIKAIGYKPLETQSAIVPIIVGDTAFAIRISERLLERGIFVTGFGFPVVPEGAARLRVQISAAHTRAHLDRALEAFAEVGKEVGLL
jgi:glycine C-acetyltransferase